MRGGWFSVVRLAAGFFLAMQHAQGQEPEARATVDSSTYLVGDWITITLRVTHPASAAVTALVGDTTGGFLVLQRPVLTPASPTESRGTMVVARYDSGQAVIPPVPVFWTVPGTAAGDTVLSNPLTVTVSTVPVDTAAEIRDLKRPLSIPVPLLDVVLILGAILLAAILVFLWYRWRKKRVSAAGEGDVAFSKPAHVIALEALGRLREQQLWQRGLVKEYYTEVTQILRSYLEGRFRIMALEETTDEILASLSAIRLSGGLLEQAARSLRQADLVKFAKHQPSVPEHEEILRVAYAFVENTRPDFVTTPEEPPLQRTADVG